MYTVKELVFHHRAILKHCLCTTKCEREQKTAQSFEKSLQLEIYKSGLLNFLSGPEFILPGESQGRGSLVGCHLRGHTEADTAEVT